MPAPELGNRQRVGPVVPTGREASGSLPSGSNRLLMWIATVVVAVAVGLLLWLSASRIERLPDFAEIEQVDELKERFFAFLLPYVREVNRRTLRDRARLLALSEEISNGGRPGWFDQRWLDRMAVEYEIEDPPDDPAEMLSILLRRVDRVPAPLALVQAAAESGWGRSRFAVEANNLFGHWCFEPGCGLVPARRPEEATHEVAAFRSVRQSVARYMHNLNTHPAYQPFRRLRQQRGSESSLEKAMALTPGLSSYSERGQDYLDELRTLLRSNANLIEELLSKSQ